MALSICSFVLYHLLDVHNSSLGGLPEYQLHLELTLLFCCTHLYLVSHEGKNDLNEHRKGEREI